MPPLHPKSRERLDKLTGTKLSVGLHKVKVLKRIGEGGSAFVYLASVTDTSSALKTPRPVDNEETAVASEDGNNGECFPLASPNSSFDDSIPISDFDTIKSDEVMDDANSLSQEVRVAHCLNTKNISTPTKKWNVFKKIKSKKKNIVVLKATSVDSSEKCKQSLVEVDILRTLSAHPNVITLIDSGFSVSHNSTQIRDLLSSSSGDVRRNNFRRIHYTLLEHCAGGSLMNLILEKRKLMHLHMNSMQGDNTGPLHTGIFTKHCGESTATDDDFQIATGSDYESTTGISSCGSASHTKNNIIKKKISSRQPSTRGMNCTTNSLQMLQLSVSSLQSPVYLDIDDVLAIFRQIVQAVSFMHNRGDGMITNHATDSNNAHQNLSPIIHRDLKPDNILLVTDPSVMIPKEHHGGNESIESLIKRKNKQWQVKLCDFGSAAIGKMSLINEKDRNAAHEMIKTSTTQMYRAPEMVDLHLTNELNEKADIWALGCTLYATCFLKNCFDENENLSIISGSYKIPENHPYGDGIVDLVKRMLIIDPNERACINEVNACLEAIQYRRPLPSSTARKGQKVNSSNIKPFWNEDLYNKSNQSSRNIPTYIHTSISQPHSCASPLRSPAITLYDSTIRSINNVNISNSAHLSSSNKGQQRHGPRHGEGKYYSNSKKDINGESRNRMNSKKNSSEISEMETISNRIGNRENIPDVGSSLLRKAIDYENSEEGLLRSQMRPKRPPLSTPGKKRYTSDAAVTGESFSSPTPSHITSDSFSPALTPSHCQINYQTEFKKGTVASNPRDGWVEFRKALP